MRSVLGETNDRAKIRKELNYAAPLLNDWNFFNVLKRLVAVSVIIGKRIPQLNSVQDVDRFGVGKGKRPEAIEKKPRTENLSNGGQMRWEGSAVDIN